MKLLKEFLRYCLVGGLAFLVDFGILVLLTECLEFNHKLSAVFGFIAGLAINYVLSKIFVFKKQVRHELTAIIVFAIIGVVGLGLTELGLWLGADIWAFDYRLVKIVVTGVVLFWNYVARKLLIFNHDAQAVEK